MNTKLVGCAAVLSSALLPAKSSHAQSFPIQNDTFLDSGSPGTPGQPNYKPSTAYVNGVDVDSYGADGKTKAVTSNYSGSYPSVTATHTLFTLPSSFWTALGSTPLVSSVVVSYYPYNDSLNTANGLGHDNMELHPLTHGFTTGNGQQSDSAKKLDASTTGGATWDTYDGTLTNTWTTPGGDFDNLAGDYVLAGVTDSTLPSTVPAGSPSAPFTWDITSLINNPVTRLELQTYGALIKVTNEANQPTYDGTNGSNDFVSFYSADDTTAGTSTATVDPTGKYVPTVSLSVPEPAGLAALATGLLAIRRRRSIR